MNMRRFFPAHRGQKVRAKPIGLALGAAALLAISAGAGMATPASAAAVVTRDSITTTLSDTGIPDDCRPGITGTIVGTEVFSFQSVETAEGFNIVGTTSGTARIDWSDGTYSILEGVHRFSFDAVGKSTTVYTETITKDLGDTYTADGVFLFRNTFHHVEHFTVTDGEVTRVDFERGHSHVFPEC